MSTDPYRAMYDLPESLELIDNIEELYDFKEYFERLLKDRIIALKSTTSLEEWNTFKVEYTRPLFSNQEVRDLENDIKDNGVKYGSDSDSDSD